VKLLPLGLCHCGGQSIQLRLDYLRNRVDRFIELGIFSGHCPLRITASVASHNECVVDRFGGASWLFGSPWRDGLQAIQFDFQVLYQSEFCGKS